jgi:hypothetical protein
VAKRSKGASGIYELEPGLGLYKVVISLGRDSTGRYRQHSRTIRRTLRDAKALRSRALTEAADRKVIARADVTVTAIRSEHDSCQDLRMTRLALAGR